MEHPVRILAFALALCAAGAAAETRFPSPDWTERPSPYATPDAPKGGRLTLGSEASPGSLNYYLECSSFTAEIFGLMYESLLSSDPETGDYAPGLASEWTVSDDGLSFTFTLDPRARWSDGLPVTAEDVRWTFEAATAPTNMTGPFKVTLAPFDPPEVLSERVVRFTAHEPHWRNLGALAGLEILPAHAFREREFNRINFDFPVVSGPYRLGTLRENVSLSLVRRPDWWAADRPANRGTCNFDEIVWRFYASRENVFDAFRKGLVDVLAVYTASTWVVQTRGEAFDRNWIVRRTVRNRHPIGMQGFAMNMRRAPYDDVRVRRALAMLLDRESMNRSMMYGLYFLHRSYWEDLYDADHPCTNELVRFDPEAAHALLLEAGFAHDPETGWLVRDGRPLVVKFLSHGGTADRFLVRYRAALESVGAQLRTEVKDWSGWLRDMDSYDFDMTWAAWGGGLHKDPEHMWSGAHADDPGGNNVTGFSDPRVDALIEEQKTEFSLERRNEICREIDAILASQVPYALLWNTDATRLLWWNKFGVPPTVLSRFGSESDAITLWWSDPESEAALRDAMEIGAPLPPPPLSGP